MPDDNPFKLRCGVGWVQKWILLAAVCIVRLVVLTIVNRLSTQSHRYILSDPVADLLFRFAGLLEILSASGPDSKR